MTTVSNNNNGAKAAVVLYSSWFCPYAQRAWMTLNELGIPYDLVESLTIDPETEIYVKHPDLYKHNPKGLVPAMVVKSTTDQPKKTYCDSLLILQELLWKNVDQDKKLLWEPQAKEWNQRICSQFYHVLMRQDPNESVQAWKDMEQALQEFSENLKNDKGSFFDGGERPGLIDFLVYPFVHRLYIIEHYKKGLSNCSIPASLSAWKLKMESLPSVQATLTSQERLIPIYLRYADGTAKSKVAQSVRQGSEAHDV